MFWEGDIVGRYGEAYSGKHAQEKERLHGVVLRLRIWVPGVIRLSVELKRIFVRKLPQGWQHPSHQPPSYLPASS